MIKTIIIDDEPLATEIVKEYLEDFPQFKVVAVCHDGFEGLKAIQEHEADLIFLDVQMPKINGFEMLELIDNIPAVIFTTAYDEYAMKAFDVHAIDYLLKPFAKERFAKAIEKFQLNGVDKNLATLMQNEELNNQEMLSRIVVKVRNDIKIIPVQDIKYMEANDDYVNIYTLEGKFLKNKTLTYFEHSLDPQTFVRVHRSYIVKVSEITKIEAYKKDSHIVKLHSGEQVPVSKTGFPKLKEVLGI
ncbi:LytTR family transcriptional regulator DNA-binding domain-containing protein [Marivirga sp. S37H4]|uniref:LytTR family transcriptional regulator DNA-binding domain-containing protein n=1 Tax=Marivirga aurantiaca TaxID=2802615 RepID=A0A934WXY4_9BACT|nr:LytTR family transcriptional regulator DNA-binding domain-containing protein [Marivirga aurantiaca]MBK6264845.1 LytTR family transcriptional regulator DNA-binding domain-containing protein [Marivirga aurantiaca]